MGNPYAQLAMDAIAKAAVLQTRAIGEIIKGDDPIVDQTYEDFVMELDECGHRWGEDCADCAMCAKFGSIMVQQMLEQLGATNA